ncbi:MAG: response regulator [Alysiella sp.]|uniref:response regulator n=1 Tax=Alysiella sp. TaxID=1872483 RepID=UPI0026DB7892|nr:response regulator [Alysiella sp.]MDO4433702.1 response regulator [Alysiella sp.]
MYQLMIVDDSNVIRNRIERSSKQIQMQVAATAANGEDAIELYQKHRPHFVTMDLTMPLMDGLECIQKLKAIDPNVNILVVSAISDRKTGLRALQYGARGFIYKPFTDDQLISALCKLAEHYRQHHKPA